MVQQSATGVLPVHWRDASGTRPCRLFLVPLRLSQAIMVPFGFKDCRVTTRDVPWLCPVCHDGRNESNTYASRPETAMSRRPASSTQ